MMLGAQVATALGTNNLKMAGAPSCCSMGSAAESAGSVVKNNALRKNWNLWSLPTPED